ncbi:ASCH domain-containing protein [Arthrobacter sp. Hz1]
MVAAVESGAKNLTSSLLREYEVSGDPLPFVEFMGSVIDSNRERLFVIETTAVDVVQLRDVPPTHAVTEGEDYASVAEWRVVHTRFWCSNEMRAELGKED